MILKGQKEPNENVAINDRRFDGHIYRNKCVNLKLSKQVNITGNHVTNCDLKNTSLFI